MGSLVADIFRWGDGRLQRLDYCELTDATIVAADSWLVTEGRALALDLHRERFLAAAAGAEQFFDAAVALIPREGDWFPRVEQHSDGRLLFRQRSAPELRRSIALTTHRGPDPRTQPGVKGPDLDALRRLRTAAQQEGADEAVIVSPDGYVVETSQSAIAWWRGSIVCVPPAEFERCDSVTARSLLALAQALGTDVLEEAVTPAELDGTEIWALNALHGPRIVTTWLDGPQPAELPGRLGLWREKLARLRHPLQEAR
jgi:branched-subunit amino acid aminotransferase/4-amino-4-deoxychorismate lyase